MALKSRRIALNGRGFKCIWLLQQNRGIQLQIRARVWLVAVVCALLGMAPTTLSATAAPRNQLFGNTTLIGANAMQKAIYERSGCFVEGNQLVVDELDFDSRKMEAKCREALKQEMRDLCGDDWVAQDSGQPLCLVSGVSHFGEDVSDEQLWAEAILKGNEHNTGFKRAFRNALKTAPGNGGWIGIFQVKYPQHCAYRYWHGIMSAETNEEMKRRPYVGHTKTRIPIVWIYTPQMQELCGVRLLKRIEHFTSKRPTSHL